MGCSAVKFGGNHEDLLEIVYWDPCRQALIANQDGWDEITASSDDIIPVIPCHWDEIIPVDGGWLPQWDEALDELTGKIEAVYFAI